MYVAAFETTQLEHDNCRPPFVAMRDFVAVLPTNEDDIKVCFELDAQIQAAMLITVVVPSQVVN